MKNLINYYYNIELEEEPVKTKDFYSFVKENKKYYFVPFNRKYEDILDLNTIINTFKLKKIDLHQILMNRDGLFLTKFGENNYILMEVSDSELDEYNLKDIIKFCRINKLNSQTLSCYQNNWANLWSEKIDYMEYQIHELGKSKPIILDSFSYFVGMAENAISYVNIVSRNTPSDLSNEVNIVHRRIFVPNYKLNYFNPLSLLIDLEVRDVAEFLKSLFFYNSEMALDNLKYYLTTKVFSYYSLGMLYARLLFPTYYFDIYEKVILNEEDEEKLLTVINKTEEYKTFLTQAYYEITKYTKIPKIEWLFN